MRAPQRTTHQRALPTSRYHQARAYCCAHHYLMVFRFSSGADRRFLTDRTAPPHPVTMDRSCETRAHFSVIQQWRVKVLRVSRDANNCAWKCKGEIGKTVKLFYRHGLNIIINKHYIFKSIEKQSNMRKHALERLRFPRLEGQQLLDWNTLV